ncbi:MAG: hypothetical protein IAI49_03575 [Candidatus Eremiobacteraeota bacterium]|nr:hypothetical protein [Candidatus Eremiobacteraeota bacterium]
MFQTSVRIALATALAAGLVMSTSPYQTTAATGLAYGSVTKFAAASDDGTPAVPGTYQADYQTAATPADAGSSPKMPFGLGKMMAKAQSAMAMFKNGVAEKHYIGVKKERVDNVGLQNADITDCVARTITHLDLAKRTYSVTSLDQPQPTAAPASGRRERPEPMATDDGTKVSMDVTTRALGPMKIEGVATNGYDTNIKMTVTKASGESSTTNMKMTAYFAPFEEPHFGCAIRPNTAMSASPAGASLATYATMMSALRNSKGDSRFTVTSSGPPIPASRLAMWQDMTMSGAGNPRDKRSGGSFGMIIERGDVRAPLSDADPIFGVPAGFTKVDA